MQDQYGNYQPNYLEASYNTTRYNDGGMTSAIKYRLDTTQLIENLEMFLRGTQNVYEQDDTGNVVMKQVQVGKPKANPAGIQAILNWVQLIINPQVVQGNFTVDSPSLSTMYYNYIIDVHKKLASNIMINLEEWAINEEEYDLIVDSIVNIIDPFMTRLIGNKERDSFGESVRTIESSKISDGSSNGGVFNPFHRK